jgi:hypothetical protein
VVDIAFLVLVWFSIAVTVVSLVPLDDWWIRAFDFPRLQICMPGLFAFVGFLLFWEPASLLDTLLLVGLGLCLVFQGSKIYPYLPIASKQVLGASTHGDDASLFLLIANVRRSYWIPGSFETRSSMSEPSNALPRFRTL